jgi:hypothetical protein
VTKELTATELMEDLAKCFKEMAENGGYHFEIVGEAVIPNFDAPHLLKGIRNNLLNIELHGKHLIEDVEKNFQ